MTRQATGAAATELHLVDRTAAAPGALRVLVLTGPGALGRVARLAGNQPLGVGRILLRELRSEASSGGELLDEALLIAHSSEEVELHLHGSPVLASRVAAALGVELDPTPGSGSLEPWVGGTGERLLERDALALMATAPGDRAARVLLDQAEGALAKDLDHLLLANAAGDRAALRAGIGALRARWSLTRRLLHPPRIVLAGPTNAGKSTLFNLLVGTERVLVSGEEGTTRDAITERAPLGNWVLEWVDTAGERELGDGLDGPQVVEAAGQVLGRRLRAGADLVLWLTRDPGSVGPEGSVGVVTCADLLSGPEQGSIQGEATKSQLRISVQRDPNAALEAVQGLVRSELGLVVEPWEAGAGSPFRSNQDEQLASLEELSQGEDMGDQVASLLGRLRAGMRQGELS
ncbi:MAG: tRNA modification GTPase [Planctomycetota bacterium]